MKFAQHCNGAVGPGLKIFSRIHAIREPALSAGRGGVPFGGSFGILRESFGQFLGDRHFIRVRVGHEGDFDTLAGNQSQRSELGLTDHEARSNGAVRPQGAGKTGSADCNTQARAGPGEIRRYVLRHRNEMLIDAGMGAENDLAGEAAGWVRAHRGQGTKMMEVRQCRLGDLTYALILAGVESDYIDYMSAAIPQRKAQGLTRRLHRAVKPWLLRLYRLAIVLAVVWILQEHASRAVSATAVPPPLDKVRRWFPEAATLGNVEPVRQSWPVLAGGGGELGRVLRTSPVADGIIGYAGPNDLLIAEELGGAVRGVSILKSGDTPDHVEDVERDPNFSAAFAGWQPGVLPVPRVEAVSGSTLTSLAMAEAVAMRLGSATGSLRFPGAVTMEEVRTLFPEAGAWDGKEVRNAGGSLIGLLLRTSPASDAVSGHGGPTESMIALEPDGKTVRAVRIRKSYDSGDYVDQVKDDRLFLKGFSGKTLDHLASLNFAAAGIEGVSGATETSYAVAEGLKRRAALAIAPQHKKPVILWQLRDTLLTLVTAGALILAFTRLRGNRWLRLGWQAVLIGYIGLASHDLLSLGLLTGWAAHGPAWRSAPALVLLGAAALLVPWATGRQV